MNNALKLSALFASVGTVVAATAAVGLPASAATPATGTAAAGTVATTFTTSWAASQPSEISVGPWANETLRMVARTSLGGSQIRIDLTNPGATTPPATFGHVTVGVQQNGGTTTAPPVAVTFGGASSVIVPGGGQVASDPVSFPVTSGTRLLVSLYVPAGSPISTAPTNPYAMQTEYNANGLDATGDQFFPTSNTFGFSTFLTGVEVSSPPKSTVVAIGDSITAGMGTAGDTDTVWTDYLAARSAPAGLGVVNMGETGDEVIADQPGNPSVSTRWTRDVLDVPGATAVIEEGGINDLRAGVTASQLEAAQTALASSAHTAGLKFLLTTLTPCGGVAGAACNAAFETQRLAYNAWVRGGAGGVDDGYADFDAALGGYSSNGVGLLNKAYDCGDHIHPNAQGNAVMAGLVPITKL